MQEKAKQPLHDQGEGEAAASIPIIVCLPQAHPAKAGATQGRPSTGGISLTQAAVSNAEAARRTLEAALEPPPAPPSAQGPRGTLIVCPLSVMSNWTSQLEEHTAGSLEVSAVCLVEGEVCAPTPGAALRDSLPGPCAHHTPSLPPPPPPGAPVPWPCAQPQPRLPRLHPLPQVHQYHGPARNRSPAFLASKDVVITTYATLAQDAAGGGGSGARPSGLQSVTWLRVVLDEAHSVKNAKSQQARAAAALKAERRCGRGREGGGEGE